MGLTWGLHIESVEILRYGADNNATGSGSGGGDGMSDYIPFSIFIALVGGLLTMATKDLLENYFAGLSLQMDAPYEEHDRITINESEMLEVRHIGIRADKFYGIESNTEIIIPHKKLIGESIVNYTLPTLDYREEISIYIPQVDIDDPTEMGSVPKRAEMLLLLSIFLNIGVKIPELIIGKEKGLDIEEELEQFKTFIDPYINRELIRTAQTDNLNDNALLETDYETLLRDNNNAVEQIWIKLNEAHTKYELEKSYNPLSNLFIYHLIDTVNSAVRDNDQKDELNEQKIITQIKTVVASILLSIDTFQKNSKILYHHIDKNFVRRQYRMFRTDKKPDPDFIQDIANELVHINYYYFILAANLWKLKDLQNSLYRKREVDSTSIELLDVPRITTEHIYSGEGQVNYWKVTANITLELGEQSNEVLHHIHMYVDNLWNDFNLPKHYRIQRNSSAVQHT